jgi:virulence factor
MLIPYLIERFKSFRKKKYLDSPAQYKYGYAFIGVGQHSYSNLYPAIQHLGIPLKKICTRNIEHARKMAARFPGCTGTNNLSAILEDDSIKGVFVCSAPNTHATIASQLLKGGKHVFVEKPPCLSMEELNVLLQHQGAQHCIPGLQKRFSTINRLLKPLLSKAVTYNYRYLTGAYPEGDFIFEIFIHPVDNLVHLFGGIKDIHIQASKNNLTYFLSITHTNGISGMLQISTDHTWAFPVDELEINTTSQIIQATYPNKLISIDKPARLLNIPLEKVFHTPGTVRVHFDNTGFIPVGDNNPVVTQGFLGELAYFAGLTEGSVKNKHFDLKDLAPTYAILEKIKRSTNG